MFSTLDYSTLRLFLDGMLAMMALYALATFIWHRKQIYAYYGLYLLGMIANLHLNDLGHILLDQHAPDSELARVGLLEVTIQNIAFVFYIRFATTLLNLRESDPFSLKISHVMLGVLVISQLADTLVLLDLSGFALSVWDVWTDMDRYVMASLSFAVVYRILQLKNTVASFFVVGTAFFVGGSIFAVTMNLAGWADRVHSQPFSFPLIPMQLGIVIESLLFTIAISFRNRQTELEKISFQAQLIHQLRENEAKQARLNSLRDEIARDLHDEMGSQLSSISIMSQVTAQLLPANDRARQRLQSIGETARQTMDSMREIVWSLNSNSESMQNVGLRIRETAYALFDGTDTHIDLSMPGLDQPDLVQAIPLSSKQRRDLFLIAKECLTNIVRHANARHVRVTFDQNADGLRLMIADDGVGFETSGMVSGLGMSSMRQRATQLGGELSIESEPGMGTTVQVLYNFSVKADTSPRLRSPNERAVSRIFA